MITDAAGLAATLTPILAPALPFLIKGGEQALTEASKKIGSDTWEWTKALWLKLVSGSAAKSGGEEKDSEIVKAATDIVNNPSDEDALTVLRFQIKKLLADDPELYLEIAEIKRNFDAAPSPQISSHSGGVHIEGSFFTNSGNIVGGNQTIGKRRG